MTNLLTWHLNNRTAPTISFPVGPGPTGAPAAHMVSRTFLITLVQHPDHLTCAVQPVHRTIPGMLWVDTLLVAGHEELLR